MSVVGRQMARSSTAPHHHRQYSDNLLDPSFNGKCLQSSNLSASQDFGFYGGFQGSKASRRYPDPATPPGCSRSSSLRQTEDELVSPSEFSPGLLDLHSFDTELLPEVPSIYEGYQLDRPGHSKGFNVSESVLNVHKLSDRPPWVPESSLHRSFSTDKERANNVAKIKVVVRKRPLNKKEIAKKEEDIIKIEPNSYSLTVHERKLKVDLTEYIEKHDFVFDAVLDEDVRNDEVYSETVEPIVPLIFNRTKATCFAYGQTGSGKTYTMQPLPLKASQDILNLMYYQYCNQGFQLFFSFFEIYGGKVFDLLNDRKKLCMREDGKQQVCIVGLQEHKVVDVEAIKELIEKGNAARTTGTTGANEESSRSHAILQLVIKRSPDGSGSKPPKAIGKLSFIDLAGSERGADTTDNDKQTRMEGAEINKSLLALKECIRALDNDQGHIPFRGSKLTEVLRDSFVGDSRTVMISCISPSSGSCEHTLNTLRYADRVKSLSKGNNSKKDPHSASSSFRDSTTLLPSTVPPEPSFEDNIADVSYGRNKFGWSKQTGIEASSPLKMDRVPSGRADGSIVASSILNVVTTDNFDYLESNTQGKVSLKHCTAKLPVYQKPFLESRPKTEAYMKVIDPPLSGLDESQTDDDLNALLKEEEDLVSAHRQQVEETMAIVKEEMSLLMEADRPGNELDKYICKLDAILSQKAAGILQLQARLVHFQKRLNEYNVLVSFTN